MDYDEFCAGFAGRQACFDCATNNALQPTLATGERRIIFEAWPFEPCPHFVAKQQEQLL